MPLKALTTRGSVAISSSVVLIWPRPILMRSKPSALNAAVKPLLKRSVKPFNLSPRPSKMLLNWLSISVKATSGKISLKGAPPPPFPLPPLPLPPPPPEPPVPPSSESSFLFKRLISSNPIKPSNSLAAFLAFLAESPRLSASPPAESPASPTASARSPASPAASCMAPLMLPTAPATPPSFTVAFLLNIKAINSASLAVTFFKTIANEFKIGIIALIIGKNAFPMFKAESFSNDLNKLILPLTDCDKVVPYLAVACSKIAIRRICCCVW